MARTKEEKRAASKRYYDINKLAMAEKKKEWLSTNREVILAKKRARSRVVDERFKYMIRRAKARGLEITITLDEYRQIIESDCFYCQGKLGSIPEVGYGIDRILNEQGYVPFNCVACCTLCNNLKSHNLSSRETLAAVQSIIDYRHNLSL